MTGLFDDLIPGRRGLFDDLVPGGEEPGIAAIGRRVAEMAPPEPTTELPFESVIPQGPAPQRSAFEDLVPPAGRASVMPTLTQALDETAPPEMMPGGRALIDPGAQGAGAVPYSFADLDEMIRRLEQPDPLAPHWSGVTGADRRAVALGEGTGGPPAPLTFGEGAGSAVRSGASGLYQSVIGFEAAALSRQLEVMNRIDRGDPVDPAEDQTNYQFMSPERRRQARADIEGKIGDAVWTMRGAGIDTMAEPVPDALRRMGEAKTFGEAWDAFMDDPWTVIGYASLQSTVSSAPSLAGGFAGRLAAGMRGLVAGTGLGSAGVEFTNSIIEGMEKGGVDLTDATSVSSALLDPAFMEGVRQRAALRAGPIAALDAASARLAGVRMHPAGVSGRTAAAIEAIPQLAGQAAAGAAGEATGQFLTGEFEPGGILLEGIAEMGSTPLDIAMARGGGRGRPGDTSLPVDRTLDPPPIDDGPGRDVPGAPPSLGAGVDPGGPQPPSLDGGRGTFYGTGQAQPQALDPTRAPQGEALPPVLDPTRMSFDDIARLLAEAERTRMAAAATRERVQRSLDAQNQPPPAEAVQGTPTPVPPAPPQVPAVNLPEAAGFPTDQDIGVQPVPEADLRPAPQAGPSPAPPPAVSRETPAVPPVGTRVRVDFGDGDQETGTVRRITPFADENGDQRTAFLLETDDGRRMDVRADDVTIEPEVADAAAPAPPPVEPAAPPAPAGPAEAAGQGEPVVRDEARRTGAHDADEQRRPSFVDADPSGSLRAGAGPADAAAPERTPAPQPEPAPVEPAPVPAVPAAARPEPVDRVGTLDAEAVGGPQEPVATPAPETAPEAPEAAPASAQAAGGRRRQFLWSEALLPGEDGPGNEARPLYDYLQKLRQVAGPRWLSHHAKTVLNLLGAETPPDSAMVPGAIRDAYRRIFDLTSPTEQQAAGATAPPEGGARVEQVEQPAAQADLAQHFADQFAAGRAFPTIVQAREAASQFQKRPIQPGTPEAKAVDEAAELGAVLAARRIIKDGWRRDGSNAGETFDRLVDLNRRMPSLNVRTSTSVANQAYSTPLPLAYLAQRLAGATARDPAAIVYEPSAGNGALLTAVPTSSAIVNELEPGRIAALRRQGFAVINQGDALEYAPKTRPTIILANPPFGTVNGPGGKPREFQVDDRYSTSQIDFAIAAKALQQMTDDGSAAIIVAGPNKLVLNSEQAKADAYQQKQKRDFYYWLYNNYNVVDHFTTAGELYAKQGAGWPVDTIVIRGRGKSDLPLPAIKAPRTLSSWDALKGLLDAQYPVRVGASPGQGLGGAAGGAAERRDGTSVAGSVPREAGAAAGGPDQAGAGPGVRDGVDRGGTGQGGEAGGRGPRQDDAAPVRARRDGEPEPARVVDGERVAPDRTDLPGADEPGSGAAGEGRRPDDVGRDGELSARDEGVAPTPSSAPTTSTDPAEQAPAEPRRQAGPTQATQVPYQPKATRAAGMGTLVPRNMQTAVDDSLDAVAAKRGDVTDYVAKSLRYSPDELARYFGAEQIDALALALDNIERGDALILGDQTGIGKGRVVAGLLRYARVNGRPGIFVTEKPNLYGDMYRDLTNIGEDVGGKDGLLGGSNGKPLRILATNAPLSMTLDEDGEVLMKSPDKAAHERRLREVAAKGLRASGYDYLFTTYSQGQTVKGEQTYRQEFLRQMAGGAFVVLDEAHNAGGDGSEQSDPKAMPRSRFFREMLEQAHSVAYSSATYAKRPDSMTLYFKTGMRHAVGKMEELAPAIAKGGVPLQQVVATMLATGGQYIRRERDFKGVIYETAETKVDDGTYDRITIALSEILALNEFVKRIAKDMVRGTGGVSTDQATGDAGAESTNFTAIMHNLINQMLLSMKAGDAARRAIEALKEDRKPVLTVAYTMGSFLQEYAEENGLKRGDAVNLDFRGLLNRYLERSRTVTIKEAFAKKGEKGEKVRLTDGDLGPHGVALYERARSTIAALRLEGLPISPIDRIRADLAAAGYKVGEITGRNHIVQYQRNGGAIYAVRSASETSPKARRKVIREFNSGEIDAVILNQAGASGLSLHASVDFKDRRRRHMIIVQPEGNIDTHMQILGRVHRTGQVIPPIYSQLVASIPAERRPAAVLAKKMASLNANTTAARGSAFTAADVPDFINQYGDQVAVQMMLEDEETNEKLGHPVKVADNGDVNSTDAMRRVTGRIPLLRLAQQEQVYDSLEKGYRALIEQLDAAGENALEAKTLELDAKQVEVAEIRPRNESGEGPFAAPVTAELLDVKRLGKPYPTATVVEMVTEAVGMTKRPGETNVDTLARAAMTPEGRHVDLVGRYTREFAGYRADYVAQKSEGKDALTARQIENLDARFTALLARWKALMEALPIGRSIRLQGDAGNLYGVVVKVARGDRKVPNPLALSTWSVTVALADPMKQVTLGFNNLFTPENKPEDARPGDIIVERAEKIGSAAVIDAFDDMQTASREKRWMVTGNLLAGFSEMRGRGTITNYYDDRGTLKQGILMPREWSLSGHQSNADVTFSTYEQVNRFMLETRGRGRVETDDGYLQISMDRGGRPLFTADRSRKKGGLYYMNARVLQAAGKDFVSASGSMLNLVDTGTARRMIEALLGQGFTLRAANEKKIAREITGKKPVTSQRVQQQVRRTAGGAISPPPAPSPSQAPTPPSRTSPSLGSARQVRAPAAAPVFYSALSRAVGAIKVDRAPREQWLGIIANLTQRGVKRAEIEWSGVEQWLRDRPSGPITKQDVLDYLRSQEVQVREMVKDGQPDQETKYDQYALPGGRNYRELLLTLPQRTDRLPDGYSVQRGMFRGGPAFEVLGPGSGRYASGATEAEAIENFYRRHSGGYRSGHFDEPNILAHVRFNERTGANGERVLFIEEIQSDWHQAGRRHGYAPRAGASPVDATGWVAKREGGEWTVSDPGGNLIASMIEAPTAAAAIQRATEIAQQERTHSQIGRVPDAPLKNTWQETAFRRMVRWAAENGFDRVAWTTGDQQADRFDLSKQVDRLRYDPENEHLSAFRGDESVINRHATPAQLPDIVGKEIADRLLKAPKVAGPIPGRLYQSISGMDLRVGGEGMRGFYDKILVDYANKWGKLFGAKVATVTIDGRRQHSLPLTDMMRDSVTREGVPLWQVQDGRQPQAPAPRAEERVLRENEAEGAYYGIYQPGEAMERNRQAWAAELQGVADRILGPGRVTVETADDILYSATPSVGGGQRLGGFVSTTDGMVWVSLAGSPAQLTQTTAHEALHALGRLGILSDDEWDTILQASEDHGWLPANLKGYYPEDMWAEEGAAYAFERFVHGSPTGIEGIDAIFRKVVEFMRQVREMVRRTLGYDPDWKDIFTRAERGDFASRPGWIDESGVSLDKARATARADMDKIAQQVRNVPPEIEVVDRKTEADLNLAKRFLLRPTEIFARWPALKALVQSGIEREQAISNHINRLNLKFDAISKPLSSDEFDELGSLLFQGDADERTYTRDELVADSVSPKVIDAYMKARDLFEEIGRYVDQHRRSMLPQVQHRKAALLARMGRLTSLADPEFRRLYHKRARLREKLRRGMGDPAAIALELDSIESGLNAIRETLPEYQEMLAETDRLEAQLAASSVRRREGYVPHKFFGTWRVFVRGTDAEGNPTWEHVAGEHGFFPSRTDAIAGAKAYLEAHPGAELKVEPVEFKFPQSDATQLSDRAYGRFIGNVREQLGLSGDELRDAIRNVATRRFRRRIAGFTRFRSGVQGYNRNIDRVVRSHIGEAVRYVQLDALKYQAISTMERMGLSPMRRENPETKVLQDAINAWLRDVNGQKQTAERSVDQWLDKLEDTPVRAALAAGGTIAGTLGIVGNPIVGALVGSYVGYRLYRGLASGGDFKSRAITGAMLGDMAHLKLGAFLNAMSAVVNLSQTLIATYPKLGERYTAVGMQKAVAALSAAALGKEDGDVRLLQRADIDARFAYTEASPHLFQKQSVASKWSMALFTKAEQFNRATAFLGAYYKAIGAGATPGQAFDKAKKLTTETQFHYGAANKPEALRNVFLRVPGQFKNFAVQIFSFMFGLKDAGEVLRFAMAILLTAGLFGIPGWEWLDYLVEAMTGWSPEREIIRQMLLMQSRGEHAGTVVNAILRGFPALLGLDLSNRTGMGDMLPKQARDLKGPWWSTIENAVRLGEQNATAVDQIRALTPGIGNPLKSLEAAADGIPLERALWRLAGAGEGPHGFGNDRAILNNPWKRGYFEYEPTTNELWLKAMGGRPLREANIQAYEQIKTKDTAQIRAREKQYLDRVIMALRASGSDPDSADFQKRKDTILAEAEAQKVQISASQVNNAIQGAMRDRGDRGLKQAPKEIREDMERLRDAAYGRTPAPPPGGVRVGEPRPAGP